MTNKPSRLEIDEKPSVGEVIVMEEVRQKPDILERLRMRLVQVDPTTEDEEREKMNLIVQHASKFPLKLRELIRIAAMDHESERQPRDFLSKMYNATAAFFFGKPFDIEGEDEDGINDENGDENETSDSSDWWHGLEFHVDSEEEAELAIRFFPGVLNEKYKSQSSSMNGCHPIYALMMCSKAMFFVPLLAELGADLGRFTEKQRGGLGCTFRGVFFQLVHDTIRKDQFDDEEQGKHDEVCTAIMERLKEKSLMKKEDIYNHNLVNLLLYKAVNDDKVAVEKRIQFLINWDPHILIDCSRSTHLVYQLVKHFVTTNDGQFPSGFLRTFRMIFELGLLHFPGEIGFLFHRNTYQLACNKFGTKVVRNIIDDEISNSLKRNKNEPQYMVFSAATKDEISLDGLYILFRRDPIATVSNLTKCK